MAPTNSRKAVTLPELYEPESVEDLFTEQIMSKLLLGFTAGLGQIPVALYDRKKRYDLFGEPGKFWSDFCRSFRKEYGMESTCIAWDKKVSSILLGDMPEEYAAQKQGLTGLFECHAHMVDMAATIYLADVPFAVLHGGQISPWQHGWERRMEGRLSEIGVDHRVAAGLVALAKPKLTDDASREAANEQLGQFKLYVQEIQDLLYKLYSQRRTASEEIFLTRVAENLVSVGSEDSTLAWQERLGAILSAASTSLGFEAIAFCLGAEPSRFRVEVWAASDGRTWGQGHTAVGPCFEQIRHDPVSLAQHSWAKRFREDLGLSLDTPCCVVGRFCEDSSSEGPSILTSILICIGEATHRFDVTAFLPKLLSEIVHNVSAHLHRIQSRQAQQKARQFAVFAAHDLKFPLHAAITLAEAIENQIVRTSCSGLDLLANLRDLRKALEEAREKTYSLERIPVPDMEVDCELVRRDLIPLLEKAVQTARGLGQDRDIPVNWIARPSHEVLVDIDEDYFRTAIGALLENAVKYSFRGKDVRVALEEESTDVVIRVSNYGIGFPPDIKPQLFEFGTRAEVEDYFKGHQRGGIGYGLAITKRIILAHHGTIDIVSHPPKEVRPELDDCRNHYVVVTIRVPGAKGVNK